MTATIDVTLLVKQFIERYLVSREDALIWATKHVDKRLYPLMKPKIREELIKRGYKVKKQQTEQTEGPDSA